MGQYGDIYTLAHEPTDGSVTGHLIAEMAREALADAEWKDAYDAIDHSCLGFPEDHPRLAYDSPELPAEPDPWMPVYGGWWLDPVSACAPLTERALELGLSAMPDIDVKDLVAAAVGAQWWCAAAAVNEVQRASSLGPDAMFSMAAILARAVGHGSATAPVPVQVIDPIWAMSRMDPYVYHARDWAAQHLDAEQLRHALLAACSDLHFSSRRESLTRYGARAARRRIDPLTR